MEEEVEIEKKLRVQGIYEYIILAMDKSSKKIAKEFNQLFSEFGKPSKLGTVIMIAFFKDVKKDWKKNMGNSKILELN